MGSKRPDTVEEWATIFLFFAGTSVPKFTQEQVLAPQFALVGSHCKLCDHTFEGSGAGHMRMHRKELTTWLDKRRHDQRNRSKEGLAAWRKEQEALAKAEARAVIANPGAYENGGDDDE